MDQLINLLCFPLLMAFSWEFFSLFFFWLPGSILRRLFLLRLSLLFSLVSIGAVIVMTGEGVVTLVVVVVVVVVVVIF